jgi:hypothetical protein
MKPSIAAALMLAVLCVAACVAAAETRPAEPAKAYRTLRQAHEAGVDPFAPDKVAAAAAADTTPGPPGIYLAGAAAAVLVVAGAVGIPPLLRWLVNRRTR